MQAGCDTTAVLRSFYVATINSGNVARFSKLQRTEVKCGVVFGGAQRYDTRSSTHSEMNEDFVKRLDLKCFEFYADGDIEKTPPANQLRILLIARDTDFQPRYQNTGRDVLGGGCCSHINSHSQVRGHRTGSSHSGAEEYPRENTHNPRLGVVQATRYDRGESSSGGGDYYQLLCCTKCLMLPQEVLGTPYAVG